MNGTSMKDRLFLMQRLREAPPDALLVSVWQPKADEIDEAVQDVAKALVEKQKESQRRMAASVATEVASSQNNAAQERLTQLQGRVEVATSVHQGLQKTCEEEQKKLQATGQNVARLTKDLVDLCKELQGVQAGSRYERLALHASKELMGGRLNHWHPGAPRAPRKEK